MSSLPIFSVLSDLVLAIQNHDALVLEAPPGAGKTTQVPLALLDQPWLGDQKIIVLEPRRLAAKTAAERMAEQLGEKIGETVGYRVRLDSKIGPDTRIEIVTEGILTRLLQSDPSLEGYGLVIFDEFHERSLDADLGLALTLQSREIFRDDQPLKLLVMSATLDGKRIAELLDNAPIIKSEGRSYPVQSIYCGQPGEFERLEQKTTNTIINALKEQSGSLLCFLPGSGEIARVAESLETQLKMSDLDNIIITPLYGDLSLQQQHAAINPAEDGIRKVVLATNIAETSLTIQGVQIVVDSGLCKVARYDPNTAMNRLFTRRISVASATQRAGRAGRLSPGVCYRLWNEGQQEQLSAFQAPEIAQADLTPLALQLFSWGVKDPRELAWLDLPPKGTFEQAKSTLYRLGALSDQDQVTPHGEMMASLPAHPRISHMLIKGHELGLTEKACQIAALLMERDPFNRNGADISLRLDWLSSKPDRHKGAWHRINQQFRHYQRLCKQLDITSSPTGKIPENMAAGLLLAFAFPDRISKQRSTGSAYYRTSIGRACELTDSDALSKNQWLTIAQVTSHEHKATDKITMAASVSPDLIQLYMPEQCSIRDTVAWNTSGDRLLQESQTCIGSLVWKSEAISAPSPDAITAATIELIRKRGLTCLPWTEELHAWKQRVIFLYLETEKNASDSIAAPNPWPDLRDNWLLANLEQWLGPYLHNISHVNHLKKLELKSILQALLPWPLPQDLENLAPERIQVPSGSRIKIDYSQSPPALAVKLQEMFGCKETPVIARGVALQVHLLSPARRPLQVTQDLESFWKNAYTEVQKEMKGRYPKHPWPDNPLEAIATAKTKRKI